jgi:hypothetical protein
MSTNQPFLTTIQGTRRFACSAVAVQAIILNAAEQVLLLSSPTKNRPDEWQIISGDHAAVAASRFVRRRMLRTRTPPVALESRRCPARRGGSSFPRRGVSGVSPPHTRLRVMEHDAGRQTDAHQ